MAKTKVVWYANTFYTKQKQKITERLKYLHYVWHLNCFPLVLGFGGKNR